MQVGNRQLPYPVINRFEALNCYRETRFRFVHGPSYKDDQTGMLVIPGACYGINNSSLEAMIDDGCIGIMLIVECPDTVYRAHWELTKEPRDIQIPFSDLKGKFYASAFAYAKKPISDYTNADLAPEFAGFLFEIEKNGFVAIDDGFSRNATHDEKTDDYVSSFVTVSKKVQDDKLMTVVLKENKIDIQIPPDQYESYDQTKYAAELKMVYFSCMLVPALADTFVKLRDQAEKQGYQFFEDFHDEYGWAKSFAASYKKRVGKELTIDELRSLNPLESAQAILDYPTVKGVADSYNLAFPQTAED